MIPTTYRGCVTQDIVDHNVLRRIKIVVMVVDPHKRVRAAVVSIIAGTPDMACCGEAATAEEALPLIGRLQPTIVLIDALTWRRAGIGFAEQLRAMKCPIRIVAMSAGDGEGMGRRSGGGVIAVVPKYEMAECLAKNLRAALKQADAVHPDGIAPDVSAVAKERRDKPGLRQLTRLERAIVELIGQGVATRAIAIRLGLSIEVVETSQKRIRGKMKITTPTQLVEYCVRWVKNVRSSARNSIPGKRSR